jgi:hypothetical protein
MIKPNQVARHVRVKLNTNFEINTLSDKYLACEPIIYISDSHIYNDEKGEYVFINGGSHINSGIAYLNELNLEFPIDDTLPMYLHASIEYNQNLSRFKNNLLK